MQERATNSPGNLRAKTLAFPQPAGDGYADTWLSELIDLVDGCMARAGVQAAGTNKAA